MTPLYDGVPSFETRTRAEIVGLGAPPFRLTEILAVDPVDRSDGACYRHHRARHSRSWRVVHRGRAPERTQTSAPWVRTADETSRKQFILVSRVARLVRARLTYLTNAGQSAIVPEVAGCAPPSADRDQSAARPEAAGPRHGVRESFRLPRGWGRAVRSRHLNFRAICGVHDIVGGCVGTMKSTLAAEAPIEAGAEHVRARPRAGGNATPASSGVDQQLDLCCVVNRN